MSHRRLASAQRSGCTAFMPISRSAPRQVQGLPGSRRSEFALMPWTRIPVKRQRFIGIARDILETIGDGFCAVDRGWKLVYVTSLAVKCGD